jgi:hypothetical protein
MRESVCQNCGGKARIPDSAWDMTFDDAEWIEGIRMCKKCAQKFHRIFQKRYDR